MGEESIKKLGKVSVSYIVNCVYYYQTKTTLNGVYVNYMVGVMVSESNVV